MIDIAQQVSPGTANRWQRLAEQTLEGHVVTADEALAILHSPDDELLDLLAAAYRLRRRWFGKTVQLYFLMNAKSGLCPEDCGYCSQSKVSEAEIPRYNLLNRRKAAGRRRRWPPSAGQDVLHRDFGPRPQRARDGRGDADRAADQGEVRPADLRLPGAADARAGRSS